MCVDAAEVALFVLKSSAHYCPPCARLILTTPLGDRLHYFYLGQEDTGSEMKSPSKDHKGNKWKRWDLNPTLLALESTANMTILNSDELHRFLYTKTLICQVPKCFLMWLLVALRKPTALHNGFLNSTTGPHEEHVLMGSAQILPALSWAPCLSTSKPLSREQLSIAPVHGWGKPAVQVIKRRGTRSQRLGWEQSVGPTLWDNSLGPRH